MNQPREKTCPQCGSVMTINPECGVFVCMNETCNHHEGLARCFCGWAVDGGDGRRQLEEMGETIDPD